MGAIKTLRARSLRLDSDRNATFSELFEEDIRQLKSGPRLWGPFEVDLGVVAETAVLEIPPEKHLVLTGVIVWKDNNGLISSYGTIEILADNGSLTGPIFLEAFAHETFRHAVTGRAPEAEGEVKIGVVLEEQGAGSLEAQIYLEGYLI